MSHSPAAAHVGQFIAFSAESVHAHGAIKGTTSEGAASVLAGGGGVQR